MCGVQDGDSGYKASAWLFGHSIGMTCSEEWICFLAASSGGAFSRDSITGIVVMHERPAAFDGGNGGIFWGGMDH